jgi:hypothetical protein
MYTTPSNRDRTHVSARWCVSYAAVCRALLAAALFVLAGCVWISFGSSSAVDLAPFKAMAANGSCADVRNRLFLIDDQWVFWDVAGSCADAAYSQTLFGSTPDDVLCSYHVSIAGPMKDCQDDQYLGMFDTMTANLDSPDLGLGSGHSVQPVSF